MRDDNYTEYLRDAEERRLDREGYDPPLGDSRAGWERDERRLDRPRLTTNEDTPECWGPVKCPECGKILQIQGFSPLWWLDCTGWQGCRRYATGRHEHLADAKREVIGGE